MRKKRRTRPQVKRRRLLLEQLEDRRLLVVVTDFLGVYEDTFGDGLDEGDPPANDFYLEISTELAERTRNVINLHSATHVDFPTNGKLSLWDVNFAPNETTTSSDRECSVEEYPHLQPGGGSVTWCDAYAYAAEPVVPSNTWVLSDEKRERMDDPIPEGFEDILAVVGGRSNILRSISAPYEIAFRDLSASTKQAWFNRPTLSGQVFLDSNADGVRDKDEEANGLAGYKVFLDSSGNGFHNKVTEYSIRPEDNLTGRLGASGWQEIGAESGDNGLFTLEKVWPSIPNADSAILIENIPKITSNGGITKFDVFKQTTGNRIRPRSGTDRDDMYVGLFELATASGVVFEDRNGDGKRDQGDEPEPGMVVYFDQNGDGKLNGDDQCLPGQGEPCTITEADGSYFLPGGDMDAELTVRSPGIPAKLFAITQTQEYKVTEGAQKFDASFGIFQRPSVGGQLFEDVDLDGELNHRIDKFLEGVPVLLDLNNDGTIDDITYTEFAGVYTFRYVPPGTHSVRVSLRNPFDQTRPTDLRGFIFTLTSGTPEFDLHLGIRPGSEFATPKIDEPDLCPVSGDGAEGEGSSAPCKAPISQADKFAIFIRMIDRIDQIQNNPDDALQLLELVTRLVRRDEKGDIVVPLKLLDVLDQLLSFRIGQLDQRSLTQKTQDFFASIPDVIAYDRFSMLFDKGTAVSYRLMTDLEYLRAMSKAIDNGAYFIATSMLKSALEEMKDSWKDWQNTSVDFIMRAVWEQKSRLFLEFAKEMVAYEGFRKAFDPDVPAEQRAFYFLTAWTDVIDKVGATRALKEGAQIALQRIAIKMFDDDAIAKLATKELVEQLGKKTLKDLADGTIIPADMLGHMGWTKKQMTALQKIAKEKGLRMRFRTTNVHSIRHIKKGALPKPSDIKAKTIQPIDVHLGFDDADVGLAGMKSGKQMIRPEKTAPCSTEFNKDLCAKIFDRFDKRSSSFVSESRTLDPEKYVIDSKGRVLSKTDTGNVKIAGDIDPVTIQTKDGRFITGEEADELLKTLNASDAQIQHNTESEFVNFTERRMAEKRAALQRQLADDPDINAEELARRLDDFDVNVAEKEIKKAKDFTRAKESSYIADTEDVIEVREDAIRKVRAKELRDLGYGEVVYGEAFFTYIDKLTGISMRVIIRGTVDTLLDELQSRRDTLNEATIDQLREALSEAGIDAGDWTPEELVDVVKSSREGILINAESRSGSSPDSEGTQITAESEAGFGLSAEALREKLGLGGLEQSDINIISLENGGYIVQSLKALEGARDANNDGAASPLDALVVINDLNSNGSTKLPDWPSRDQYSKDINRDGYLSPLDVLQIINYLNERASSEVFAEGEAIILVEVASSVVKSQINVAASSRDDYEAMDQVSLEPAADENHGRGPTSQDPGSLVDQRDFTLDALVDEWAFDFWSSEENELVSELLAVDTLTAGRR
jgi:Dockerin type I domain